MKSGVTFQNSVVKNQIYLKISAPYMHSILTPYKSKASTQFE